MLKECTSNQIPQRLVIAFEMANAEQTPLPLPDISSPSNNFANLSFIISISAQIHREKKKIRKLKILNRISILYSFTSSVAKFSTRKKSPKFFQENIEID